MIFLVSSTSPGEVFQSYPLTQFEISSPPPFRPPFLIEEYSSGSFLFSPFQASSLSFYHFDPFFTFVFFIPVLLANTASYLPGFF